MSGNGAPQPWPGSGPIPPMQPGAGQPGEIPALPPALIAAPPGVDGAPLRQAPTPPAPNRMESRRTAVRQPADGLGPAFAGSPAGTGLRIAAFTLDAAAVVLAAAIVLVFSQSLLLAGLAVFELALFLWVLEARTGITLGNAVLRLRSARADRPYSPGVGRQFVRGIITGAGFLVAVGSWVIVASGAWDRSGRRQSWADRVAGTVVVSVPARAAVAPSSQAPVVDAVEPLAPPQVVPLGAHSAVVDEDSEPTDARAASHRTATPEPTAPGTEKPLFTVAPTPAPQAGPESAAPASETGALLLIFDTGQRVQLALPLAANLGRAPVASAHDDRLIIVTDPDASVSKTHLRIEHSRGRTWVTDFGSTNGSDIRADDGQTTELVAGERVLLDDADRVRIGNRSFTISLLLGTDSSAGERA
ncbi:RDD family protein [Microbacterium oxydans]|uniref:RDD family protein n=1 Tax=Microbacterium oxydans TaxID=82380 RepID=A0A0F0KLX5_9MICO|nr:FHA domain-containing protein [Microbacterium oxydans]KJL21444.1 RDD family protein [Microbacterium oxydans]